MKSEHLDRVLEIERLSFPEPYSRELFEEELSLKIAHLKIVKLENILVGFIDYWIVKDEVQLINLAVDPVFRKRQIGSFLMKHLEEIAQEKKAKKIFLDVRESNLAAISLYKKFGYETVRLRKKYYSNGENGLVMVRGIQIG